MKRFILAFLSIMMVLTCITGTAFAASPSTEENGKTVVIEGDLSDSSTYIDEVNRLMADPSVERVRVIDPSLITIPPSATINPDNGISPAGGPKYYTYRITNVTIGADYVGNEAIATAYGSPGDTLTISETKAVSHTYSCSVSNISAYQITSAVGYDVTKSTSIEISGSTVVPKKNDGKTVKTLKYYAYPVYQTSNFTVQRKEHHGAYHMLPWKDHGSGYSRKPYGVDFQKVWVYA